MENFRWKKCSPRFQAFLGWYVHSLKKWGPQPSECRPVLLDAGVPICPSICPICGTHPLLWNNVWSLLLLRSLLQGPSHKGGLRRSSPWKCTCHGRNRNQNMSQSAERWMTVPGEPFYHGPFPVNARDRCGKISQTAFQPHWGWFLWLP